MYDYALRNDYAQQNFKLGNSNLFLGKALTKNFRYTRAKSHCQTSICKLEENGFNMYI